MLLYQEQGLEHWFSNLSAPRNHPGVSKDIDVCVSLPRESDLIVLVMTRALGIFCLLCLVLLVRGQVDMEGGSGRFQYNKQMSKFQRRKFSYYHAQDASSPSHDPLDSGIRKRRNNPSL